MDTREITMGYIQTIGGEITSWMSQWQNTVSKPTSEAEYTTLSEASKEQKLTQMLLQEVVWADTIGYNYVDNELYFLNQEKFPNKTKHIYIGDNFIR